MKIALFTLQLLLILILISSKILSQLQVYSEAPIIFDDNGIRRSSQITINFNQNIIDLPKGKSLASIQDIPVKFSHVNDFLKSLIDKYGEINLIKQVPDCDWGDVWKPNIVTGQLVKIIDMSQLFTISFSQLVPIDSIIKELETLPEIEYSHGPIQTIQYAQPNDQFYGSQWSLTKINAPLAWDFTKGSVKVGIIDPTLAQRDHPDLFSKFTEGQGDIGEPGYHATQVAGVIGAITNNSIGISSLGWDLKMNSYTYLPSIDGGSLASAINRAVADTCKVISFSFSTVQEQAFPSCGQKCSRLIQKDFQTVRIAISNAINLGVVITAAAGNDSPNLGYDLYLMFCEGNCDIFPYTPYPTNYPGVIGVSATDINNIFAGGLHYNYGNFVDVCAPGISILTTDTISGYITTDGSSLSAPLVASLAGLIKSINPSLLPNEVESIIYGTITDLGTPGKDNYFGYGLINASRALLETLDRMATQTKSANQTATGYNNARRLVKDNSGNYHLIFASGGEIFYRKIIGGTTWQTPIRLSNGIANCNYPSISESGGRVYATWQRNTSQNNYDIYFAASTDGGSSWNNKYVLNSISLGFDPLPAIQAISNYEMVIFRTSAGIKSYWSYYANPSDATYWVQRTCGFSTSYSPSVTNAYQSSTNYFPLAMANSSDSRIYYYYFDPISSNWSGGPTDLSSIVPGANAVHLTPSITSIPGTSQVHVAWKKLIGSGSSPYDHLIIHRRSTNLNTWPNEWFGTYYQNQEMPSISALASNKVDLLYQSPQALGSTSVYKMRFNGSSWGAPVSVASNSKYPSISSGSTTSKYVYTSGSTTPFTIMLSSETLSKEDVVNSLDNYTRSVAWLDSTGSFLEIKFHPLFIKLKDGSKQRIDFVPVSLDTFDLTVNNSWSLISSNPFILPSNAEEIVFDYSISAEGAEKIFDEPLNSLKPFFKLVKGTESVSSASNEHALNYGKLSEDRFIMSLPVNEINKLASLKAEIKLEGLKFKSGVFASLGHIYDYSNLFNDIPDESQKTLAEITPVDKYDIQNYPNPFNPSTTINYKIPHDGMVTIKVFDIIGNEITTLVNEPKPAGLYQAEFKAQNLSSGIYIYTIKVSSSKGGFLASKKMAFIK